MALTSTEKNRRYRKRYPERVAEAERHYRETHPDKMREKHRRRVEEGRAAAGARRYREKYPERAREALRRYRENHPDRVRENNRRGYEKRREDEKCRKANREKSRLFREANPEVAREQLAKWKKDNPGKINAAAARRRALKRGALGDHTAAEFGAVCKAQGGRCAYCGDRATLTRDHVIALGDGGSHDIGNIVGACLPCNSSKNAKPIEVWLGLTPAELMATLERPVL